MHDILSIHSKLRRLRLDAVLLNHSEFLPSINVKYLTGFSGSNAAVLITKDERHFFTDGRYDTQSHEQVHGFMIHIEKSKLDPIVRLIKRCGIKKLGIEGNRLTYLFAQELIKRTSVQLIPLKSDYIDNMRICKTQDEVDQIRLAAKIASQSCKALLSAGLENKTEIAVAGELEYLFRKNGASGLAFDTIIASGERSALPHGTATEKVITADELVILDYGCTLASGYRSDETVTCKLGKLTKDEKKIADAVKKAHDKALSAVKLNIEIKKLDLIARDVIDKAGFGKYFMHSLGHGLGLETHEPPYLSARGRGVVQDGMVFTIEPGVYIQGIGGVRLESLVHVTAGGVEVLSGMEKKVISL